MANPGSWRYKIALTVLVVLVASAFPGVGRAETEDADEEKQRTSHYVRSAYQIGAVLQTNSFVSGDNASGEPIDRFHSLRVEFGWQTNGSADWHHRYNFPSFGVGIYGADYINGDELGEPTSLYGFFCWPLARGNRWNFNFDLAFGFTKNWEAYDPVENPNNNAFGLGRSVHIDGGFNAEYKLTRRWSLLGGFTFTHFSNGGSQLPNNGLNQIGPLLYVKYATDEPTPLPKERRHGLPFDGGWDLTYALALGNRNLNLDVEGLDESYYDFLNRDYLIGNLTIMMGRKFTGMSRYCFGFDIGYDSTVPDLMEVDAYNKGYNATSDFWDKMELAANAGYEHVVNRTHFVLHFGYIFWRKEVEGDLPAFYQRLGLKQFIYKDFFAGMNVRFHELGSADNLEWNIGFVNKL